MTSENGFKRVVVTGQGVSTPLGTGVDKFWAAVKKGECAIGPVTSFDVQDLYITIGGEVTDFDPRRDLENRGMVLADRYSQLAGVCSQEAMGQSGLELPLVDGSRAASIIGSGIGGLTTLEKSYHDLFVLKKKATNPLTLLRAIGSSAAALVSMAYGIKGPCFGTVSACSTATHAIGLAFQMIRSGQIDIGICGASEAVLCFGSYRSWQALRVLSPEGCFPFSKTRNGTVLAEGAGLLLLEEYEHAKARGANILAELKGFGMTSDAGDMVNPSVEGPTAAMQIAIDQAGIAPSDIDYINAHGTATTINDANETNAIKAVFGKSANDVAISSTKSMMGHSLGACGGIEAVVCIKAMEDNFVPATIGLAEADPACDLDYVPNVGRDKEVNYTLSNSFAFGGLNTALVFGPKPD